MRAANLMPGDDRMARSARAVDSGGFVYVLLGGLAGLVALTAVWTMSNKELGDSRAKLDRVNAEAKVAEARVAKAAPYQRFAALARDRVATVTSLSATRFDWSHGLREVSRVLPGDVWLTSINGTSGAKDGAPSPTSNVAPAPTFELLGCTSDQARVARLMARLRAVDGVRDVALKDSTKPDGTGGEDCPANRSSNPRFSLSIAFAVPGAPKATVDATGSVVEASAPVPAPTTPSTTNTSSE